MQDNILLINFNQFESEYVFSIKKNINRVQFPIDMNLYIYYWPSPFHQRSEPRCQSSPIH